MPAAPHILDLHLTLRDVDQPVRRTLRVSSGATLARAQRLICTCFGWNGGRFYTFEAGPLRYSAKGRNGDAGELRLRQLLPDAGAELEFEYGDASVWYVHVRVAKIFAPSDAIPTPRCLDADGIAPPLNAGGAAAWNERAQESADDLPFELAGASRRARVQVPVGVDAINAELALLR